MEDAELRKVTRWGRVQAWWLLHPGTDIDHFGVLAAMATYADADGICDPSQATLAKRLKRSRPWVNRVVAQLVEIGLIEKTVRSRRNGGTTSCEYRLRMIEGDAPVTAVTPAGHDDDTPCHRADGNQLLSEQNQEALASGARAEAVHVSPESEPLPDGWSPSAETVSQALALLPDARIEEHTALFLARCRSKGYRIARDKADDTWLAWLIEDSRKLRARERPGPSVGSPRGRADPAAARADRYSAWGAAASAPPLRHAGVMR